MRGLDPTPQEREIIHTLLVEHGITDNYEVAPSNFEGKELPGSAHHREIMSQQGYIVTPSKAYYYWLDWYNGHYTLGHEEGIWEEINDIDESPDRKSLLKIRAHLLQRLQNASSDKEKA